MYCYWITRIRKKYIYVDIGWTNGVLLMCGTLLWLIMTNTQWYPQNSFPKCRIAHFVTPSPQVNVGCWISFNSSIDTFFFKWPKMLDVLWCATLKQFTRCTQTHVFFQHWFGEKGVVNLFFSRMHLHFSFLWVYFLFSSEKWRFRLLTFRPRSFGLFWVYLQSRAPEKKRKREKGVVDVISYVENKIISWEHPLICDRLKPCKNLCHTDSTTTSTTWRADAPIHQMNYYTDNMESGRSTTTRTTSGCITTSSISTQYIFF